MSQKRYNMWKCDENVKFKINSFFRTIDDKERGSFNASYFREKNKIIFEAFDGNLNFVILPLIVKYF